MKKKDYFLGIILVCLGFVFFYFISKHELNYVQFLRKCKKYDLTILDVTNQFQDDDSIKKGFIAESKDFWQIEFYQFESRNSAKKKYKTIKEEYPILKSKSKYAEQKSSFSYSQFTAVTDQRYVHVCRIGKTILYVNAPSEYQRDIEKVIRKLGY